MDVTPRHPAPYSDAIFYHLGNFLDPSHKTILDPFGGIGRIHELHNHVYWAVTTVSSEIEPEWAQVAAATYCGQQSSQPPSKKRSLEAHSIIGDALALPFADSAFDAVVTSPTYGNRFADHHDARDGSVRRSYTHDLGHHLHINNSGTLQWGDSYRDFHQRAWVEILRVLRPGGRLLLNISDHIRGGKRQYVSSWHVGVLLGDGLGLVSAVSVSTPRMKYGANREKRLSSELVLAFEKGA